MVEKQDNVFYYLTLLNENYAMPGLTAGTEEQIIKGMYLCKEGKKLTPRVQLLGSGTILREAIAAQWSCQADPPATVEKTVALATALHMG